jgi:hypothetical protein
MIRTWVLASLESEILEQRRLIFEAYKQRQSKEGEEIDD